MLINETGKMTGVFEKLGLFYESCLRFGKEEVDFAPGKINFHYFFPVLRSTTRFRASVYAYENSIVIETRTNTRNKRKRHALFLLS